METVLLILRLLLGAVFVVAAVGKLLDRRGTRQALSQFGVPGPFVPIGAVALPLLELAVAGALTVTASARWGAAAALALLLTFTLAIAANLARGRTPDCHCFGQIRSGPVDSRTIVRNGILAVLAGLVLWQGAGTPTTAIVSWISTIGWGQFAVWALLFILIGVVAVEASLLSALLRQNGRTTLRLEALEAAVQRGLPVGTPAPDFDLPAPDGSRLSLESLTAAGKPVLLLFADCTRCAAHLLDTAHSDRPNPNRISVAVISRLQAAKGNRRRKRKQEPALRVGLQADREVAAAYHVVGTPSAVMIRSDGVIATPIATGPNAIRALLLQTLDGRPPGLVVEDETRPHFSAS